MATIRYRKDRDKWIVSAHHGGATVTKMFTTKDEALTYQRGLHADERKGVNVVEGLQKARQVAASTLPTLETALMTFLEMRLATRKNRQSSVRMYRHALRRHCFPRLGQTPVDQVTAEQVTAMVEAMQTTCGYETVKQVVKPLRLFFKAHRTLTDPTRDLDLGARPRRAVGKYFHQDDGATLLKAIESVERYAVAFKAMLLGGLRPGEAQALMVEDIDWKRSRIHVQRTVSRAQKGWTI